MTIRGMVREVALSEFRGGHDGGGIVGLEICLLVVSYAESDGGGHAEGLELCETGGVGRCGARAGRGDGSEGGLDLSSHLGCCELGVELEKMAVFVVHEDIGGTVSSGIGMGWSAENVSLLTGLLCPSTSIFTDIGVEVDDSTRDTRPGIPSS